MPQQASTQLMSIMYLIRTLLMHRRHSCDVLIPFEGGVASWRSFRRAIVWPRVNRSLIVLLHAAGPKKHAAPTSNITFDQ